MARAAVLMAEGYEEGETLTIVDILRRAGIECHTFSFGEEYVKGMHQMYVKADCVFDDSVLDYDLLVLPGGRPGGANLCRNLEVIKMVRQFNEAGKHLAAMCSGTVVLAEAKVIEGKKVTGYTGYEEKLTGGIFCEEVVVSDQNLITSQGPATVYPFAFKIAECLGKGEEVAVMKVRLMYDFAGGR